MNSLTQKAIIVVLIWLGVSIIGGGLITAGFDIDISMGFSLLIFFIAYYVGISYVYNSSESKNININDSKDDVDDFLLNVKLMQSRAMQIYQFDEIKETDQRIIQHAYKQALLRTIINDDLYGENRTAYFGVAFKKSIRMQKNRSKLASILLPQASERSYISIDKCVLDVYEKKNKSNFQKEYLVYMGYVLEKSHIGFEELSIAYKIDHGYISINKWFNNIFGYFILNILGLIDSNIERLGARNIVELEIPTQKNEAGIG